jgi:Zn-finger domain-containing protein
MTTTEELVAQVNKILDDIGIDMAGLFEDLDVPRLAYTLGKNVSLLTELEEELERRVGETLPSFQTPDRKNRDPHLQWIYRKKRNRILALERLRSAITAHKIALSHLSANYSFYLGKTPVKPESIKKEELERIRVERRPVQIGRMEILPHLAYSGDVLRLLARENIEVRETFKFIKGKLRERGTVQTRGLRIEVEYWSENRLKKDRIDLPADADIEGELRKRYGRRFRWRILSFVKTRGVLINNHYTVDNISLAYALLDPRKGPEKLALDLFRYYFLTSSFERERLTLYPGIRACIDCHYSLFDLPFRNESGFKVGFGSMLLMRKCEIEGMISGKRADISSIPNHLLGGVILYGISHWDERKVSEVLGLDYSELVDAIRKFVLSGLHTTLFSNAEKFEKFLPKSDKAKKFLALLQG